MKKNPRILITTQVYPPEFQPTAVMVREFAHYLIGKGWDVQVVAGFPHHPYGKLFSGYKMWLWSKKTENGIPVLRVAHFISKNRSIPVRAFVYLSQALGCMLAGMAVEKPDLIIDYGPPLAGPFLQWLVAKRHGAKLVNVIYDVYPDIAIETGKVTNPIVIAMARWAGKFQYSAADRTVVLSEGLKKLLIQKGVPAEKISVIPVWLDPNEIKPLPRDNAWRRENKIPIDKTVVLYAGTIGVISGAEIVADVAAILRDHKDIVFVLVGSGEARAPLEAKAKDLGLNNIMFFPYQDRKRLSEVQATGDIGLVTLLPGRGRTSVPSKVLGYLAAGRPVIASVDLDSDTADDIGKANAGLVVEPANPKALAEAVLKAKNDPAWREVAGKNARAHLERNYAWNNVLEQYRQVLDDVINYK